MICDLCDCDMRQSPGCRALDFCIYCANNLIEKQRDIKDVQLFAYYIDGTTKEFLKEFFLVSLKSKKKFK